MSKKSNLSLLTLAALFTMSAHAEETIPGTTYYVGAPGGDVGYDYTFEVCQDDVCLDYPSVGEYSSKYSCQYSRWRCSFKNC